MRNIKTIRFGQTISRIEHVQHDSDFPQEYHPFWWWELIFDISMCSWHVTYLNSFSLLNRCCPSTIIWNPFLDGWFSICFLFFYPTRKDDPICWIGWFKHHPVISSFSRGPGFGNCSLRCTSTGLDNFSQRLRQHFEYARLALLHCSKRGRGIPGVTFLCFCQRKGDEDDYDMIR